MDPFEVYAYWDSWRTSPNLTLTLMQNFADNGRQLPNCVPCLESRIG